MPSWLDSAPGLGWLRAWTKPAKSWTDWGARFVPPYAEARKIMKTPEAQKAMQGLDWADRTIARPVTHLTTAPFQQSKGKGWRDRSNAPWYTPSLIGPLGQAAQAAGLTITKDKGLSWKTPQEAAKIRKERYEAWRTPTGLKGFAEVANPLYMMPLAAGPAAATKGLGLAAKGAAKAGAPKAATMLGRGAGYAQIAERGAAAAEALPGQLIGKGIGAGYKKVKGAVAKPESKTAISGMTTPEVAFKGAMAGTDVGGTGLGKPKGVEIKYRQGTKGTHIVEAVDPQGNVVGRGRFVDTPTGIKYEPGGILYVDPKFRRQGIGRSIAEAVEQKTGKRLTESPVTTGEGAAFQNAYFKGRTPEPQAAPPQAVTPSPMKAAAQSVIPETPLSPAMVEPPKVASGASGGVTPPVKPIAAAESHGGFMPDLRPAQQVLDIVSHPDLARKFANLPGVDRVARVVAGKAATLKDPVEKWAVVRQVLKEEGRGKVTASVATLDKLGSSKRVFGLADDGTIKAGPLKGLHLNEVRTYPEKYASKLTKEQKKWVDSAARIERGQTSLLKRNGIDINELAFEDGGVWAGRRVAVRLNAEGEMIEAAYIGAGAARPGAKAAFEKARIFKNIADAQKEGFRYLPEEVTVHLNAQAAYNRVANKQADEWLLKNIQTRGTSAPKDVLDASAAAKKQFGQAKNADAVVNRAIRGENIPEGTLKSLERSFPDLPIRERMGDPAALKELKPQIKELIETMARQRKAAVSAAAKARESAMRTHVGEARINAPAFQGKIITGPNAEKIAKAVNAEIAPELISALTAVNKINEVGRYFALAGDASPATIQLLFMAGQNPLRHGKVMGGFVRAMFDTNFHAEYLVRHMPTVNKHPDMLLTRGGASEFTEAMAQNGILRKGPFKLGGKVLEPFQRGFETALDMAGIELAEAFDHLAVGARRTAELDAWINEFRGLSSRTKLGVSAGQRQAENAVVLTMRYNQAIASLLTDVFKGNLRGSLARESLGKSIAAIAGMTVAISLALGEDEEEIVEHLNPTSGRFVTWNIGGQNIGPGTKVRSILKLFGDSAENPDKLWNLSMENPALRFARGNLAPVTGTGLDLLTGKDFMGDPTRDGLPSLTKTVIAENLTPIWMQSVLYEGGAPQDRAIRGAGEFAGMRTYPESKWDTYARKLGDLAGKDYEDLSAYEREQLEKQYPILSEMREDASLEMEARGYNPKQSEYWQQRSFVQSERVVRLEAADRAFQARRISPSQLREIIQDTGSDVGAQYRALDNAYSQVVIDMDKKAKSNTEKAREKGWMVDYGYKRYWDIMNDPSLTDELGRFNYGERDKQLMALQQEIGAENWQKVYNWVNASKNDYPLSVRQYYSAVETLKPYWGIEDQAWRMYPREKQINDQIKILESTDPDEAKRILKRYPMIVAVRKKIAQQKKQLRMRNPQIEQALVWYR